MSPKKTEPASAKAVLPVSVALLARLLDLPPGVEVVGVEVNGEALDLTLAGVDGGLVRGWDGAGPPELLTADYSVDAHGHRSLVALTIPDLTEEKE